jgi:hypothetical protein
MKRRRIGRLVAGIIGVLIVAGLVVFGALSMANPPKPKPLVKPAPTTAFSLTTGVLAPGWKLNGQAATYLNLAGANGCFTTSTLTTVANYQGLSSVAAFNQAFAPTYVQKGYTIVSVSTHPLKINASGTIRTVNAIYYVLTQDANTTYHIDSSELGSKTVAFMGISCPTATQLENAQIALLGVTYNTAFKP